MSSITRKKLSRGVKLYREHVGTPLQSAATALSGVITPDQMQSAKSTFRINLNVPYVDSAFWSQGIPNGLFGVPCYSIPFTIPPFQEDISITPAAGRAPNTFEYKPTAPRFYLDEISFGFDQRDESCMIADRFFDFTAASNAKFDSEMNFEDITKCNIRLAIYEHKMTYWDVNEDLPTTKSNEEDVGEELWGVRVPNVAYAGKDHRANPVLVDNIDTEIFPHRTYVFGIYAPDLEYSGANNKPSYALSALTISLKIRCDLDRRDIGATSVQNIPTKHNGLPTAASVSITMPAAGAVITADQAGGLSQNLATIDESFRGKLKGGFTENAETVPNQNLWADSGYEVIAVPMFQNRRYAVSTDVTAAYEPYCDTSAAIGSQFMADRRIIPIHHPFTLHHVLLAYNYQVCRNKAALSPPTLYRVPDSSGFTVDIGVAMATGLESDNYTYEQLAQKTLTAPDYTVTGATNWFDTCIDRIRVSGLERQTMCAKSNAAPNPSWWQWEMHQIPIAGSGGTGYIAQGKPIFIGKAWSPTWTRSNMADGAQANTGGAEQFIEVRMRLRDTARDLDTSPGAGEETLYVGYQGHWVYLIGKKTVV